MIVYVLTIVHQYGENISVHETDIGANLAVLSYCKSEWEREIGDDPMPEDAGQLIATYFANVENESFGVEECEILNESASEMLYTLA